MVSGMDKGPFESRKDNYVFHYHCPVLIVTANKKEYGNNAADCAAPWKS